MAIKKVLMSVEMNDGTEHENIRVTVPDQLQWARTARQKGWDPQDQITAGYFMVWHALKRLGLYTGTWEKFSTEDAVAVDETDDETTVEDEQDPTVPTT